ncbi:MAG: hypothetical protein K0S02_1621 [Achromobacter mucicolens]|uniref:hypothetical protein n=1 Tax=Achromobacter mucicolens TaxID=1389922 RepID=UPI00243180EE|nr:hypothetical protein [Achromobacter mucicolens]MDF2861349.1 hypothetical protein [Achromobacter mucicolens]
MSSSSTKSGGVRTEQEIVQPTARAEAASIAALPQWVMVQVQAILDSRGLNPFYSDVASALDAFALIRTSQVSDMATASDLIATLTQLALRDLSLAGDALTWRASQPLRDASANADGGSIFKQSYATNYVENTYVGEELTSF